jgi:hypothetical protein
MTKGSSFVFIPLICVYGEPVQGSIPATHFESRRAPARPHHRGPQKSDSPAAFLESCRGYFAKPDNQEGARGFGPALILGTSVFFTTNT